MPTAASHTAKAQCDKQIQTLNNRKKHTEHIRR